MAYIPANNSDIDFDEAEFADRQQEINEEHEDSLAQELFQFDQDFSHDVKEMRKKNRHSKTPKSNNKNKYKKGKTMTNKNSSNKDKFTYDSFMADEFEERKLFIREERKDEIAKANYFARTKHNNKGNSKVKKIKVHYKGSNGLNIPVAIVA